MVPPTILSALALASMVSAISSKSTLSTTALESIAPETTSCDGAPYPDECVTAAQAAPYIDISFLNFGIDDFNTQAALVAMMLFESGNFKYNINHFPGTPGQGTRNMQSPAFNEKYATWLSSVCSNCGISKEDLAQATSNGPAAVLNLVTGMQWSVGSAAWFLKTQCDASIRDGLATGTEAGWTSYLEQCVGTPVTAERTAGWKRALALGKWS